MKRLTFAVAALLAACVLEAVTLAPSQPFALDSRRVVWSAGEPMPLCTEPAGIVLIVR